MSKRFKRKASFTVEASIIIPIILFIFINTISLSIKLNEDVREMANREPSEQKWKVTRVLIIKYVGGEVFDEFKTKYSVSEEIGKQLSGD